MIEPVTATPDPTPSPARRRALICGVTGQDGAYLARLLLDKGYEVTGTSHDATVANLAGLVALGIRPQVRVASTGCSNDSPTELCPARL